MARDSDGIDRDSLEYKAGRLEAFREACQTLTRLASEAHKSAEAVTMLGRCFHVIQQLYELHLEKMQAETAAVKPAGRTLTKKEREEVEDILSGNPTRPKRR